MEMIAASKLRSASKAVVSTRPYYERLTSSLGTALRAVEQAGEELPEVARNRGETRVVCLSWPETGVWLVAIMLPS